jgi:outer membrane protein, multidrug efflux system
VSGRALVIVALMVGVGGCAVGHNYRRPPLEVPAQYRGAAGDASAPSLADLGWRQVYPDPDLQGLLAAAFRNNLDLKIAVARLDQARAALGIARVGQLPQIEVSGNATRTKASQYAASPGITERTHNSAAVQAEVSYEVDFWGRLRRTSEAARADLLASEYGRRAVAVTLVADVATAYFDLLSLDSQLEITRRTVTSREKFVELTRAQHERGVASGLDVATAEAQLAVARSNVPDLERQIVQTEDLLSSLLGENPRAMLRAARGERLPQAPPQPPVGLPSMLLDRRPDVLAAEQGLVAANARVGVAKAALFPRISLTGIAGSLSVPLSTLLTGPAATWSASAALVQPILDPLANYYQVELADARKREALLVYEKAVRSAFQEVADALIAYQKNADFARELATQVDALQRSEDIALARYRVGYASYFDVINADRDLFGAELQLAQASRNELTSLVQLYQVLGGGWQSAPG